MSLAYQMFKIYLDSFLKNVLGQDIQYIIASSPHKNNTLGTNLALMYTGDKLRIANLLSSYLSNIDSSYWKIIFIDRLFVNIEFKDSAFLDIINDQGIQIFKNRAWQVYNSNQVFDIKTKKLDISVMYANWGDLTINEIRKIQNENTN